MILHPVRAACAHSAKVPRGTLGTKKERSKGYSLKINAEGSTPSGPSLSLQAFRAMMSKILSSTLGDPFEAFLNYVFMGSLYLSPIPYALSCFVSDF